MSALVLAVLALLLLSHAPGMWRLLIARLSHMRVDRVIVGLLPVLRRGKWVIGAIPLGTFVLIAGRDATGQPADPALFKSRAWPWKGMVLLGGPFSYYFVAAALMALSYAAFGVPVAGTRPMVGSVSAGLAAERAGLRSGDRIVAINGQPMNDTNQIAPAVRAGPSPLTIEVIRDGEPLTFHVASSDDGHGARIGIEVWPVEEYQPAPIGVALWEGAKFPARYGALIVHQLFALRSKVEFSGPVGMVKVMRKQVSNGARATLESIALVAVYLGYCLSPTAQVASGAASLGRSSAASRNSRRRHRNGGSAGSHGLVDRAPFDEGRPGGRDHLRSVGRRTADTTPHRLDDRTAHDAVHHRLSRL